MTSTYKPCYYAMTNVVEIDIASYGHLLLNENVIDIQKSFSIFQDDKNLGRLEAFAYSTILLSIYAGYFGFGFIDFLVELFMIKQVATLTGHTLRVLYLAISPDGQVRICI